MKTSKNVTQFNALVKIVVLLFDQKILKQSHSVMVFNAAYAYVCVIVCTLWESVCA